MKIGKIYRDAIMPSIIEEPKEVKVEQKEEGAVTQQIKIQWLASSVTEELIKSLEIKKEELLNKAINFAITFSEHKNHDRIIDALIRYDETNNQIKQIKNT